MSGEMSKYLSNPRHSFGDHSESSKKIILQPMRIKDMLDIYENEDDDSDNKNDDSEEDNELDECQPSAPNDDTVKLEKCGKLLGSAAGSDVKNRQGLPSSALGKLTHYPTVNTGSDFNWKSYNEEKPNRQASASREVLHSENYDKKKTRSNEFTSDFSKMSIDGSRAGVISCPEGPPVQEESNASSLKVQSGTSTSGTSGMAQCDNIIKPNIPRNEGKEIVQHSTAERHIHGVVTYKSDAGIPPNGPAQRSTSTIGADSGVSNAPDTPLKLHCIAGSMRPIPTTSRRNILQTPQGKTCDFSTNHEQTPASILGSWRHGNIMHTSGHIRMEPGDIETPGKSILSNNETPWKSKNWEKRVRRPLEETMAKQSDQPPPPRQFNELKENPTAGGQSIPVPSSVNYELKENLGPVPFEKPAVKMVRPDQQQPPRDADFNQQKKNNCPQSKQPDSQPFQPISLATASAVTTCQYGKRMSIKGREYLILGSLGQGMSGEVYRVQDLNNFQLKAVKYVNLARMDQESAQSCVNEIKMLSKLQAASVVTMYDHEVKNQSIYVVMEMGDTDFSRFLKSVAAEKRRLPLTMILYYWTEMLTAVKHIHDNGVIHSDLKPANFLLVRGRLKLIDFGISSSLNAEMTSIVKNTTVGTLNYISPEALMDVGGAGDSSHQNTKYKISYKSDVWSLGCILYSLVYGNTPFHNIRQQWAKISAITNPTPQISFSLPTHVEAVPAILIDVIKKCLQHDPKARPSVQQLLQIQYISTSKNPSTIPPDIPPNILLKIKQSLDDSEWRTFTEILEQRRHH